MVKVFTLGNRAAWSGQDCGVERTVVVLRLDFLRWARKEANISLRQRAGILSVHDFVHNGDGRLGDDGERGDDDLQSVLAELGHSQVRIVLPGKQHVPLVPLGKGDRAAARTGVQHRDMTEQLSEIGVGLIPVTAIGLERPAEGGEVVPARATRRLRIGRDDADTRLDQIGPVMDALRIAFTHHE